MVKEASVTVKKPQISTGIKAFFPVQTEAASRNTEATTNLLPTSIAAKPSGAVQGKKWQREKPQTSEPKKTTVSSLKCRAPTRVRAVASNSCTSEIFDSEEQWAAYDRCV
jgi:hypothetical protein